jgi:hypothetical protein
MARRATRKQKGHVTPREGLVGAHKGRRQARTSPLERNQRSVADEPVGDGATVAPTPQAAARERERHRLQREVGVVPAGEDGNLRQRRSPKVTRRALDDAAARADQRRAKPAARR